MSTATGNISAALRFVLTCRAKPCTCIFVGSGQLQSPQTFPCQQGPGRSTFIAVPSPCLARLRQDGGPAPSRLAPGAGRSRACPAPCGPMKPVCPLRTHPRAGAWPGGPRRDCRNGAHHGKPWCRRKPRLQGKAAPPAAFGQGSALARRIQKTGRSDALTRQAAQARPGARGASPSPGAVLRRTLTKPFTRTHSERLQPTGSGSRHPKGDPAQSTRQGSGSSRHCGEGTGRASPPSSAQRAKDHAGPAQGQPPATPSPWRGWTGCSG
jgi:hypothetical protein